MGLVDDIKKQAAENRTKIQDSESARLEKILNKMFYLEKNIEEETKFIKQVMTRGLESQERKGLHASAIIVSDNKFCLRQQVLSLWYKMQQGEQVNIGLKRIFEEGNAIHEKWQRLFIRAGYSEAVDLDKTEFCEEYELSYTPDIICRIEEFYEGDMVGEIKSVNTFQFNNMVKKGTRHTSGEKQCQLYMHLKGLKKGFVLCEDKNTQEFLVFVLDYDYQVVKPFIKRLERVKNKKKRLLKEKKMVKRKKGCDSPTCKIASSCNMRDACYNVGMGRIRLD